MTEEKFQYGRPESGTLIPPENTTGVDISHHGSAIYVPLDDFNRKLREVDEKLVAAAKANVRENAHAHNLIYRLVDITDKLIEVVNHHFATHNSSGSIHERLGQPLLDDLKQLQEDLHDIDR